MLTQQQIAQLLPADLEIAKKHPDWVYYRTGNRPSKEILSAYLSFTQEQAEKFHPYLRLFPHRKVEIHTYDSEMGIVITSPENEDWFYRNGIELTDLNQSVTVLIFDETLLNK